MPSTVILEKTIYTIDQLEEMPLPQLALAGRSNVGKSSLLNKLTGRKNLAKISSTPGKTRSLNFYKVSPEEFYLVDLPGYGYARCSKTERDKWAALINKYLRNNARLFGVVALLDSRLPPQALDIDLIAFIRAQGIDVFPVMTKADKCKQPVRSANQAAWQRLLGSQKPPLLTSSHSGMNIDKLWQFFLDKFAATKPHE
ncbi:MAG: ribosome biogenesis GTP-binding protein YihA/YsxC [Desulfomicrobium sp.]|nr:ribosome biogenesis GTP-binding protein YihA/YsxC [Pseudomonadota bacterium]MBV1711248.1 ribosome biogenesis GTP-binding protein YihA/YsxC [Desulfomicrobium sp.]MBU4569919.1 ribosome biogenesis GTP-binding protein YihA/YsxC [Pseudomonadota bacterium]MBU4595018.1 ribosome biogenesis GTP-binding protein YihA/YsxC [Pseudomonadota bacterium]MBV1720151.1 ribosome biogenesis GTP-binding protein YihA/YsxC [Desulfomicrobium sp.]